MQGPACQVFCRTVLKSRLAKTWGFSAAPAWIADTLGSPATIKQHMSAIRMLFSWLTGKGILAMNPAREVKTEKFSRTEGKTPAFNTEQVQKVLDKIDTSTEVGLRDRALLGTLPPSTFRRTVSG